MANIVKHYAFNTYIYLHNPVKLNIILKHGFDIHIYATLIYYLFVFNATSFVFSLSLSLSQSERILFSAVKLFLLNIVEITKP